ncbi:MAG: hypothetical protein IKJ97_04715 [Bacteroidaceae bacterium]|nr:hypothetical protein [Bacteroidaceae bacterium]
MLFVARTLHIPSGAGQSSKVVEVVHGKVVSVTDFVKEVYSMAFIDDIYLSVSSSPVHLHDLIKEACHPGEPLYAFTADESGNLSQLL